MHSASIPLSLIEAGRSALSIRDPHSPDAAITLHHPGSGAVLASADTEEEAAALHETLGRQGDYPVVLGPGGVLVAIDPAAGVPDCDEDDARTFQGWRSRWDALNQKAADKAVDHGQ